MWDYAIFDAYVEPQKPAGIHGKGDEPEPTALRPQPLLGPGGRRVSRCFSAGPATSNANFIMGRTCPLGSTRGDDPNSFLLLHAHTGRASPEQLFNYLAAR